MAWIIITILDPNMQPLPGVALNATSPQFGPWNGVTNCAGQFIPNLGPGHYDIRLSKPGYKEYTWPTDLGDCGPITQAMEYDNAPVTRDRIINVQGNFLNLYDSDDIPIWDAYLSTLLVQGNLTKFNEWIQRLRAMGSTHINLPIAYNYNEPLGWAPRYPIDGMDFTNHLGDFVPIVEHIQSLGFIPIIKLAMDGQAFDPNGWTYGWQWGLDNIERIANSLSAFINTALWSTGYDGCFPNWTRAQTILVLQRLRAVLGQTVCIDTEFAGPGSVGYCHMGNGAGDWTPDTLGILDNFSVEVMTYPPDPTGVQQVAARLLGGQAKNIDPANYLANQPPSDSNSYLAQMDKIKKINICLYEDIAFQIIRKQATTINAYNAALACANYGFSSFGNGLPTLP